MTTINALMAELLAELIDGEVPDPLRQDFPLFTLWHDLATLAGETVPAEVAELLNQPIRLAVAVPLPRAVPKPSQRPGRDHLPIVH